MDDNLLAVVLVGILVLIGAVVLMAVYIPEPPNRVVIPTEQVNAAVIQFENRTSWGTLGEDLRIRLENELVNRAGISIFSRTRLDQILAEQRLCALGLCDPQTAVQIGRLTGVNKLVTGIILGASRTTQDTQICKQWQLWPPSCQQYVPGTAVRTEVEVQFQILNAQTGRIEVSERLTDWASESAENGKPLPDTLTLLRRTLDSLSRQIANRVQSSYTRELCYGFYKDYQPKGNGYEGVSPATTFTLADGRVVLLVHLMRMQSGDQFVIRWIDPQGNATATPPQFISGSTWIPFTLPLLGKQTGAWRAEGYINGQRVFADTFTLTVY